MEMLIFSLLLFTFCLGQLGRISVFRPDLVIHLNDIVIGVIVLNFFLFKFWKKQKIFLPKFIQPIGAFFLIGVISLLVNLRNYQLEDIGVGSLYLIRWLAYGMLTVVVFNWCKTEKKKGEKVLGFLILAGTITAIIGLFQYLFFPDLRPLKESGWDPHVYRVVGTFFDPGFIGAILVLNIILLINFLFLEKKTDSIAYFFPLAFSYLSMVLTYSRSTYLIFLFSMLLISILKKMPRFFLTVVLIFFLTLQVIPKGKSYGTKLERQETWWARLESYKTAIKIFKKNPFLGVGFNNYRYAQIKYNFIAKDKSLKSHAAAGADNSFLFILATTGIIGLMSYLWMWGEIIKSTRLLKMSKQGEGFRKFVLWPSLFGIFVQSFFINSLFYPFIMEWLWILVGTLESFKENS